MASSAMSASSTAAAAVVFFVFCARMRTTPELEFLGRARRDALNGTERSPETSTRCHLTLQMQNQKLSERDARDEHLASGAAISLPARPVAFVFHFPLFSFALASTYHDRHRVLRGAREIPSRVFEFSLSGRERRRK